MREINRKAILAWSPSSNHAGLIAGGSYCAMDDSFSTNSALEIFDLDLTANVRQLKCLGSVEVPFQFHRLAWGSKGTTDGSYPYGLLAGGLDNGGICIWNPAKLINGPAKPEEALLTSMDRHKGPVRGLEFNPFQPNLLVSGSSENEILIWDISNIKKPTEYTPGTQSQQQRASEIGCVAWNKCVQHILASASQNGYCTVWDLKSKRHIAQIMEPKVSRCRALAWHPEISTQMATASEDDRSPVILVWDLRNAYSPLMELTGHSKGVMSLSWCPQDSGMLLSCGKDGRTLCWNPQQGQLICEISSNRGINFDVQWSPKIAGLLSSSSFDNVVNVYSMQEIRNALPSASSTSNAAAPGTHNKDSHDFDGIGATTAAGGVDVAPPPKWMMRPCSAVFGFGGKLIHFFAAEKPPGLVEKPVRKVVVSQVVLCEPEVAVRADKLADAVAKETFVDYCNANAQREDEDEKERMLWRYLSVMFQKDSRRNLLKLIGFKAPESYIPNGSSAGAGAGSLSTPPHASATAGDNHNDTKNDDEDHGFGGSSGGSGGSGKKSKKGKDAKGGKAHNNKDEDHFGGSSSSNNNINRDNFLIWEEDDVVGKEATRALVAGDYETAVDVCMEKGRESEALLLAASAYNPDLWAKTRARFFAKRQGSVFARISQMLLDHNILEVVSNATTAQWDAVLAVVLSYAHVDEFAGLCDALGERLLSAGRNVESEFEGSVNNNSNSNNALLCFMLAANLGRCVSIWEEELFSSSATTMHLQMLMERVAMVSWCSSHPKPPQQLIGRYYEYAQFLTQQGRLPTAMAYLEIINNNYNTNANNNTEEDSSNNNQINLEGYAVLRERVARSLDDNTSIAFPFTVVNVNVYHPPPPQVQPAQEEQDQAKQAQQPQQPQQQVPQQQQPYNPYQQHASPVFQSQANPYQQSPAFQTQYQQPQQPQQQPQQAGYQVSPVFPAQQNNIYSQPQYTQVQPQQPQQQQPQVNVFNPQQLLHSQQQPQSQYPLQPAQHYGGVVQTVDLIPTATTAKSLQPPQTNVQVFDPTKQQHQQPQPASQQIQQPHQQPQAQNGNKPAPQQQQQQPQKPQVKQTQPQDVVSLPAEQQMIYNVLMGLHKQASDDAKKKKQVKAVDKGFDILFSKLTRGEIPVAVLQLLVKMCQDLQGKDFKSATAVVNEMATSHFTEVTEYLSALKTIILLSKP